MDDLKARELTSDPAKKRCLVFRGAHTPLHEFLSLYKRRVMDLVSIVDAIPPRSELERQKETQRTNLIYGWNNVDMFQQVLDFFEAEIRDSDRFY